MPPADRASSGGSDDDGAALRDAGAAVSGDSLAIVTRDGGVMVGSAKVMKTDIGASNGVIHVIDTVLLPEMK